MANRLYNANQSLRALDKSLDSEKGMRDEGRQMVFEAGANIDEVGNSRDKRFGPVSVGGFKPELVTGDPKHPLDQGQDVYRHVLYFAGNTMAGDDWLNGFAMANDVRQVRRGRKESIAELNDDYAGLAVGNAMVQTTRAGNGADYAGLARAIMGILCL